MKTGSDQWQQLLKIHALDLGVPLDQASLGQLAWHACELLRWNRKINLTRITEPLALLVKHYLDALSVVPFLPQQGRVLDIGSGGGFPGLPIKLSTCDLEVFLIEASRKKVHFLKHVIRSLNLKDIQAEHIRAEALAQQLQPSERFNVVISRAVSSLEAFYAMAAPLAAAGGALMAMKSKALPAEIAAFDSASKSANDSKHPFNSAISITVKHLKLPLLDLERSIVIMRQPTA